jgi:hypothetical protein
MALVLKNRGTYSLKELVLCKVNFPKVQDIRDFARVLTEEPSCLARLNITSVSLNDSAVVGSLCRFLESNSSLRELCLGCCNLSAKHLASLINALKPNSQMTHLNLHDNTVSN